MQCHEAIYDRRHGAYSQDCNGTEFWRWVNWEDRTPIHHCMRVNHYWTKSFDEWLAKRARGRAPSTEVRAVDDYQAFGRWFGNNNTAINPFIPNVHRGLARRKPCRG
jgi:hypothetical protein